MLNEGASTDSYKFGKTSGTIMRFRALTVAAILGLTFSFGSWAQGMGDGGAHGDQGMMQSSPNASKAPFDLQFIDTMIVHHQGAIDMAQLAEKQAGHEELKQLAKRIIEDQQKEIKQMQGWKQEWYAGKGDALNMKMHGMAPSMRGMSLDKLASAKGDAFDAMFIDMMIPHHEGAIVMARDAAKKAQHKEIKAMARNIIDAQKKEIEQMAKWKKEWKLSGK